MSLAFDAFTLPLALVDWVILVFLTPDFGACLSGPGLGLKLYCLVFAMISIEVGGLNRTTYNVYSVDV